MFDENEITSAVLIQHRSYRLLRWLEGAIRSGFVRLDRAHQYTTVAEAAEQWLAEHFRNLPLDCRPPESAGREFRRFANFFASYLTTSFDIDPKPGKRLLSPCGCYCPICTYLSDAPHLKAKKIRSIDKRRAEELMRAYLEEVAKENNESLSAELEFSSVNDPATRRDVALRPTERNYCGGVADIHPGRLFSHCGASSPGNQRARPIRRSSCKHRPF